MIKYSPYCTESYHFLHFWDSIYASISERLQRRRRPTLNGFGKSDLDLTHVCNVRLVTENFSIISSELIKSLSTIFNPLLCLQTTNSINKHKKKEKKGIDKK